MGKYLWMAVEADEYELPLAVTDTARELGEIYGIGACSVMDSVLKKRNGRELGRRYLKVRNEEWE